jgi:DNA-binding helix-hairpin-helix protein with protein kinase domain
MAVAEARSQRDELLGAGGEAEVYRVPGHPELAEKRWRNPTLQQSRKLELMLAHPPEGAIAGGHVNLAWPVAAVRSSTGDVVGFRMPAIDLERAVPVFSAYNPHARRDEIPGITWRHLVRGGRNLASVVAALHRSGYVVGDLNESNVLIDRRALVTILDCDSIQVADPATGEVHHCGVARPEFLAPELIGKDLSATTRRESADRFALAVMLFLLLQEGVHPYAGVWRGPGEPPDLTSRMRGRRWPYFIGSRVGLPPRSLRMRGLGLRIRLMFTAAFLLGPLLRSARPSAVAWESALARLEERLRPCGRSPMHLRVGRRRCPWCRRVDAGMSDPWPDAAGKGVRPRPLGTMARWRRQLAASTRSAGRSIRLSAGSWLWLRTSGFRRSAPMTAALIAAWSVAPLEAGAFVAVAFAVLRWRRGSLRASARSLRRWERLARRKVRPAIWWAAAVACAATSAATPY